MNFISFANKLETWQFALIMLAIVLLGIILSALTGFIVVKRNHVAIIEKMGNFVGIYKPGLYYFAPLLYRRVGMYKIDKIEKIIEIKKEEYKLNYEIEDVKMFHYIGKHDVETILVRALKENDNLSETLTKNYKQIGVKFISLEKVIKR